MMRRFAIGLLTASAVAVAGCGSSTTTSASTTAVPIVPTTTTASIATTTTIPTPTTTSAPATSATSPPTTGSGACGAPDLSATLQEPGNGAAGTIYYTIKVTNITNGPCLTGGYFGVSTYDVAGQAISTQDERIQQSDIRNFTLAPGGSLTFMVGLSDVSTATQTSCPQVGALHLIPPNDTRFVQLSLLNASGQGAQIVGCTSNLPVTPAAAS